jgi:hypothetical protein
MPPAAPEISGVAGGLFFVQALSIDDFQLPRRQPVRP